MQGQCNPLKYYCSLIPKRGWVQLLGSCSRHLLSVVWVSWQLSYEKVVKAALDKAEQKGN